MRLDTSGDRVLFRIEDNGRGMPEEVQQRPSLGMVGMRARARFNDKLDPRVIVGEHGWWQACAELGLPAYDLYSSEGSNFNFTVDATIRDPVSGTPEHRANLCQVSPA